MFASLSPIWQVCVEQAWEAYCAGSIPISAVVVDAQGRIISVGRSRQREMTPGENCRVIYNHRLAHAEINALLAADFQVHDPGRCVLYVLAEPCPLCIGAIVMANLIEYHYASRDNWAGSTELLQATAYMRSKKVQAIGPEGGAFETTLVAWQLEYTLSLDAKRAEPVLKASETDLPRSVAAARQMHRDGVIQKMRREGKSARDMFDALYRSVEKAEEGGKTGLITTN